MADGKGSQAQGPNIVVLGAVVVGLLGTLFGIFAVDSYDYEAEADRGSPVVVEYCGDVECDPVAGAPAGCTQVDAQEDCIQSHTSSNCPEGNCQVSVQAAQLLPEFRIWGSLIALNIGLALAALFALAVGYTRWILVERKRSDFPAGPRWGSALGAFFYAFLVTAVVIVITAWAGGPLGRVGSKPEPALLEFIERVDEVASYATLLGLLVAFFGLVALALITALALDDWSTISTGHRYESLNKLRLGAKAVLSALSLMVIAGIFATGAEETLAGVVFGEAFERTDGRALFFGALLSAALALAYLPAHSALSGQAERLVEDVAPMSISPFDADAIKRRDSVGALVRSSKSGRTTFEENLLIAGPLLSGLFALLT